MKTRDLTFIAMMVAMAVVLEIICSTSVFNSFWPHGGHPTLSAIPLIILGWKKGMPIALIAGALVGVLQFDPYVYNPLQYILDYPAAFAFMGLGAFLVRYFKPEGVIKERLLLGIGIFITMMGRYLMHVISGLLFFSDGIFNWATISFCFTYNVFVLATAIISIYAMMLLFDYCKRLEIN